MKPPRIFDHWPEDLTCPVCGTQLDEPCVLLGIDGTQEGQNEEAQPVHLNCAVASRYNREMKIMYRKLDETRL